MQSFSYVFLPSLSQYLFSLTLCPLLSGRTFQKITSTQHIGVFAIPLFISSSPLLNESRNKERGCGTTRKRRAKKIKGERFCYYVTILLSLSFSSSFYYSAVAAAFAVAIVVSYLFVFLHGERRRNAGAKERRNCRLSVLLLSTFSFIPFFDVVFVVVAAAVAATTSSCIFTIATMRAAI